MATLYVTVSARIEFAIGKHWPAAIAGKFQIDSTLRGKLTHHDRAVVG